MSYFSVKQPVKIAGKVFQPCICYNLTPVFELNVAKLVAEGKATLYEKEVFFQNGRVITAKPVEEKPAPVVKEEPAEVQDAPVVQDAPKTKKKAKKEPEEETF